MELDAAIDGRIWDFLSSINDADSASAVWEETIKFMRGYGASHIGAYVTTGHIDPVVLGTTPPWVWDEYLSEISPESDPATRHCRENVTPYFGGQAFDEVNPSINPKLKAYLGSLADIGIRASVMFPMHDRTNRDWGRFIFDTDLSADDFRKYFGEHGTSLHLAGIMSIERLHNLALQAGRMEARLTNRERECLLWLARGLRNDRIAERMGLRPVTVGLHISNACRKLDARTRAQALVKAIQFGMLQP